MPLMWWRVSGLMVLFACGGPGSSPPWQGGSRADAAVDALDPASAVTVTVMLDHVPQPDVMVYFQSSYLGPWTELRTDANGSAIAAAEAMFYDEAAVTVVNPFGQLDATTDELLTYNGVKPGDHIAVTRASKPPSAVSFTLTAPADSPAAKRYLLHTNCGAATLLIDSSSAQVGGPVTLQGCGTTVDMLVESLDDAGHSLSWLYQADVAVSDGGSVKVTGAYQTSRSKTFSYHTSAYNRPQLEIRARLLTAKGIVYESPALVLPVSYMNEYPSLTVALPSLPGAVVVTETVYRSGDYGLEHTVDWGPDTTSYMLDLEPLGSLLEEYLSRPTLNGFGIGYTFSGGALRADYMRARLSVTRPGDRGWEWHFVSPPATYGGGSQPWPRIPSDIHPYNVRVGDVWSVPEATLVHVPGGYDAVRADSLSVASPLGQLTGPSGRLVYETVLPP